jgi:predicted N-acetyltransferase YhbS
MTDEKPSIRLEVPADLAAVGALSAHSLGPGRFARTAYRVRNGAAAVEGLSFAGWIADELIGSIRFTELVIGGETGALLLGPLVIDPRYMSRGCGLALMERGLNQAREQGYRLIILVGDVEYYQRVGFVRCPPGQVTLPGPVDPKRLLAFELEEGALSDYRGLVRSVQDAPG